MPVFLTPNFIQHAQRTPVRVDYKDMELVIEATSVRAGFLIPELQIRNGDTVIGYITPYTENEHGAVQAQQLGVAPPPLFRTLEEAVREIAG